MSEQRKIVEDTPQMRSVALHPVTMPMMPRASPLARSKAAPVAVTPAIGKAAFQNERLWKVSHAPSLPSYHPLERTHVKVPNASTQEVASRIVECLRKQSVAARYNDKEVSHARSLSHKTKVYWN